MSYTWSTDYLNLSTMLSRGQDPRDKEPPMIDHSADLLDIMPMDYIETQSTTSTMSYDSVPPTTADVLMSNIEALTSLQEVTSYLQHVHVQSNNAHMPFNVHSQVMLPVPTMQPPPGLPGLPAPRDSFSSVVKRPNAQDLWRSTLVQPPPDFSVYNPSGKLPETHTQQTAFDPENAEIDDSYCVLCKRNGEVREWYTSHVLKDNRGKVACPILRKYTCPTCGATGDNAHTIRHCPKSTNKQKSSASSNKGFRV